MKYRRKKVVEVEGNHLNMMATISAAQQQVGKLNAHCQAGLSESQKAAEPTQCQLNISRKISRRWNEEIHGVLQQASLRAKRRYPDL